MVTFAISSFKPGTQTAHMVSSGAQLSAQTYAQEAHSFQQNTAAQQQQLKQTLGPSVVVGKYDIPSMNLRAPLGTSIFQLLREREFAE